MKAEGRWKIISPELEVSFKSAWVTAVVEKQVNIEIGSWNFKQQ